MKTNEPLEQLLALTGAIERAATLADWPEAARLTEKRSPLLMSIGAQQNPAALAIIRRIQAIDAAIMANAQTTSIELQAEYSTAMARVTAVSAYHRIARL